MQAIGYPLSLFIKTVVPPELFCSICKNVMRDPVTCLSCKIWLCVSCTPNACNFGNEKHSYSPINRFIKSKIDEYQIKCKYSAQGCLKVLKISAIEKHQETCEFSKAREKIQPIPGCESQFNATNCPTSNYKCTTCKKQMMMTEKKDHDCIKWLLEFRDLLEKENARFQQENEDLLKERDRKEKEHQNFKAESNDQKQNLETDNENKKNDIESLKKEIEITKKTKDEKIASKMREFYEFADGKNQKLQEKNEKEREILFKRINNCTLDYLDFVKKGLFEFNCKVQADSTDLSSIPIDMKEYDKSPLRNFNNVGPVSVYKK